jgi:protein-tyrosine phosphatase
MTDTLPLSVPLQGISNFRDLGGYRAKDGRRVRAGRVFRAATLAGITPQDQRVLESLGLTAICDLRGIKERERLPDPALPGATAVHLPIEPTVGASLRDIAHTREATGEDVLSIMRRGYQAYAIDFASHYRRILTLAADPGQAAIVFHCSAGKDRTGFGAALLLSALGVAWDDVMEDYLATNRLWRPDPSLFERLPTAVTDVLFTAHETLLLTAFETIAAHSGTFDSYLSDHLGMTNQHRAALEAAMLV